MSKKQPKKQPRKPSTRPPQREELEQQGHIHKDTIIFLLYLLINDFYEPMLYELKERFPEAWNHIMQVPNKEIWKIEQMMRTLYQDAEIQQLMKTELAAWNKKHAKPDTEPS